MKTLHISSIHSEADFPDEGVKEIDDLLKWSTSLDENELNNT